jgi:hypothetical protein
MTQKLEATMNVDAIRRILTYNTHRPAFHEIEPVLPSPC